MMQMHKCFAYIFILWMAYLPLYSQPKPLMGSQLFLQENTLKISLKADFQELRKNKDSDEFRKGYFSVSNDTTRVNLVPIELKPRGNFRRALCNPPPLLLNFKTDKTSPLYKLGRLKLVHACAADELSDQLLLKEYLVYKMYQLLTNLSFRVRLAQVEMVLNDGSRYSNNRYAFFLEDVDALAKRNNGEELEVEQIHTESMDRATNTLVAIFQFMIGNTDWSISKMHNIKLVQRNELPGSAPFAIPYDFDNSGLVNAPYALPSDDLPIQSVTERLYRGYSRSFEELEEVLEVFRTKKPELLGVIQDCAALNKKSRQEMEEYLNSFFDIINNKQKVKEFFMANARTQ